MTKHITITLTEDQANMVELALGEYAEACDDYWNDKEHSEGMETIAFIKRILKKLELAKS